MSEDIQSKLDEIKQILCILRMCSKAEDEPGLKSSEMASIVMERILRPLMEDLLYMIDEWRVG